MLIEVKFTDKVPLTPGNVPTKFRSNKLNTFGEKCTNIISDPKNGRHFPGSRSFEVKLVNVDSLYKKLSTYLMGVIELLLLTGQEVFYLQREHILNVIGYKYR